MRSLDVGRYRHNYEVFYEIFMCQMFINREKITTTKGVIASLVRVLSFLLFLFW